jgi:hypothetical protein
MTIPGFSSPTPPGGAAAQDEWDNVPEVIKQQGITREQWLWLSDGEKARLIQDMTEPEA